MTIAMRYRPIHYHTVTTCLSLLLLAMFVSPGRSQEIGIGEFTNTTFNPTTSATIRVNNATGIAGGLPATGTATSVPSGWSTFEYGADSGANVGFPISFLQINSTTTPGNQFTINLVSTIVSGNGGTPGVAANFDPTHSYSWVMFRPDTNAGTTGADNVNPTLLNTNAPLIFKDGSGADIAKTDANLNLYVKLDTTGWNWGSVPVDQRGSFSLAFVTLYDSGLNTQRGIAINYTPVPEPGAVLALAAGALGLGGLLRRRRRRANGAAEGCQLEG